MRTKSTKADYVAYVNRWRVVNEYERSVLRRTPIARKLRQLTALMASATLFPESDALGADDTQIRERWNLLRGAHRRG